MTEELPPDAPAPETPETPAAPNEPEAAAELEPSAEPDPFWSYGDVALFCGLAVPALLLGWAAVRGVEALFQFHFAARAIDPLLQQLTGYLLLFGGLMAIFRAQYGKPFWRSLGWNEMRLPALAVMSLGVGAAFTVALVGSLLAVPNSPNTVTELMSDRTSLIALTVFGVTIGPVCEELAFRGFLQPVLVRSLGPAAGILLSAIPFGLMHYQEYGNSWRHAAIVAGAGAAFGCMRQVTGSTKAAALMHASYNALFFGVVIAGRNDLIR